MSRAQVLRLNADGSRVLCKGCGVAMFTTDPEGYHRACFPADSLNTQYIAAAFDYITCRGRPHCESCKKFEKMIRALKREQENKKVVKS